MSTGASEEGGLQACPSCRSSQIYARMVATPKYRCNGCHHEFDEPMLRKSGDGPKRHVGSE